jgi:hypothetical protein
MLQFHEFVRVFVHCKTGDKPFFVLLKRRHPRAGGDPVAIRYLLEISWIPAYAGMTITF